MSSQIDESKINSPSHYNIEGELETIEKMEQYMTEDELISWCEGCIFTYIDRAKYKNGLEDLHKALWHVNYGLQYPQTNNNFNYYFRHNFDHPPDYNLLKWQIFHYLKEWDFVSVKVILDYMIDYYDDL